jgi:4-amino-4-deoxy-L-arabinose transferase-like glycosyltransferase
MNKKIFLTYFLFVLIVIFGGFLRFWQLDSIPPGLHGDEAGIGYSAYSILKTGLSQFATSNPLAIQEDSGGSRPPLYAYTLIPLINFFDLNIFVERLPAAIFGTLTLIIMFFLVRKLFKSNTVALVAGMLMAINPWAIQISRQGLLESQPVFLIMLGTLCFVYGSTKRFLYIFSAFFLGLSLFAYDAPKIFLPPFVLLLMIYQWHDFIKIKKYAVIFLIILAILYGLMLKVVIFDGQLRDYAWVSVFNPKTVSQIVNDQRHETNAPLWLSSLVHNKVSVYAQSFITSYVDIFSLNWFFINGHGNLQQAVVRYGEFNLFELPFFFLGTYVIFTKNKRLGFLLIGWLLIGALPGGFTTGNYPYRSVLLLPVPIIFSSLGFVFFWNYLKQYKLVVSLSIKTLLVVFCVICFGYYFVTYYFDYPVYASQWWSKQQNDVIHYAVVNQDKYDNVFIDGRWESQYAFQTKTDPKEYQSAYLAQTSYKDVPTITLGKFTFGSFYTKDNSAKSPKNFFPKNSLVITDGQQFSSIKPFTQFVGPDGITVLYKVFVIK